MGIASDYESLLKVFANDDELKTLMLIPDSDKNNMVKLRDMYFTQAYNSDTITDLTQSCKIVFRNTQKRETNNKCVKIDGLIIDIFVKNADEYIILQRRTHKIADRLIKLLHNKHIDSWEYRFVDSGELMSETGYKRYFIRFEYKRIYG